VSHCDLEPDADLLSRLADQGIVLGFDTFGHEHYRDRTGEPDPRDTERLRVLLELLRRGYGSSLVLSQDLACKIECVAYGGWGLSHVDRHIVPALRAASVTADELSLMRVGTPARILTRACS
jgi:phosphotriesterase-related protein